MSVSKTLWQYCKKLTLQSHVRSQGKTNPVYGGSRHRLVLLVTDRCNFNCRHCLRSEERTDDLETGLALRIIDEAAHFNFRHLIIAGGEPLLYPDIEKLLEAIRRNNGSFSLVTNGSLFEKHLALFKEFRPQTSFIAFSVESSTPEQHDHIRQAGSYVKLLRAFSLCRKEHIPFRIVTALSTANVDEIFDIALRSRKQGARTLVLTTVLPCPNSRENNYVLDAKKREEILLLISSLSKIAGIPIILSADLRTCNILRMCSAMNLDEVTINAQGELVQCCELANFGESNTRKNARITSAQDKTFAQILESLSQRLNVLEHERIRDIQNARAPHDINLNSCFYCINKLRPLQKP